MKTFKLVDLNVERLDKDDQPIEQFPLLDGLIINKEDGEKHWSRPNTFLFLTC